MRSGIRLLKLALLGIVLSSIGGSGWYTNTSAQQPQAQPPDICPKDKPTVIVDSVQKLQDAINDLDCTEIIVQGGIYEVNLAILRDNLTIKSLAGDRKRPTFKGPLPDRQTITIAKSSKVTIQGLIIEKKLGNVGILISEQSTEIRLIDNVIHGYPEAGISIANSQVELEGNRIGGDFNLDGINTQANGVGVRIINSNVSMTANIMRRNNQDGIEITDSTVTLGGNTISRNTGCGVKADPKSTVTTPSDDQRNWIFGNAGGNTCPGELSRAIRRPEILVPSHLKTLQEAIRDAEPVRGEGDRPYTILLQQGDYAENLCIDRSVTIAPDPEARQPVRIHPADAQKPTIAIGTQDCPLHKEEKGNIDKEAGDQTPSVRIYIRGANIVGPSGSTTADGFQIGTLHSDRAQRTFLKVKLQDSTIEKFVKGLMISPSAKDHKLDVQILGTQPLQDAVCTSKEYPSFLRGEPPTPPSASIQNNQEGIRLENPKQADLSVYVRDVEIKGNASYGIFYEGEGNSQLSIERSRIIENQQGIRATSKGTDSQASDKITVQLGRIWQNKTGGVKLEATARSKLDSKLIDVDVRQNTGFGVYIQGNAEIVLKASNDTPISSLEPPHNCGIANNFGPGVRAHGSAVLAVENMFVDGNGYEDEKKTKPIPRPSERGVAKVGPDGIFASDFVQLMVRNTYVGPNNAGVGIALQASNKDDKQQLKAVLNDNYVDSNRKWGISYIIRSCLDERTMPDDFYGKVEGQNNVLVGNGFRLSRTEDGAGPGEGLGRGQVCPKELDFLIVRVQ